MKDGPAFQLYAADFYMDTISWSNEEIGMYFRLLMCEWINGPLPFEARKLQHICQMGAKKWHKRWQIVGEKFKLNGDGKLVNERLEKVREEQLVYREKQSESGKRGIEAKRKKGIYPFDKSSDPSSPASSNPSSNPATQNQALHPSSSSLTYSKKNKSPKKEPLSQLLFDLILKRRPTFKKPDLTIWAKSIDLMIRVDKRNPDEIERVIRWCQADEFWQNNILSTTKLRKQFDQLALKAYKMGAVQDDTDKMKCKKCGDSGQYISLDENGLCANCRYGG